MSGISSDDSGSCKSPFWECPSCDFSDNSSSQGASYPLSVSLLSNCAGSSSLVLEGSDDLWSVQPADVSSLIALSPDGTSVRSSVESSNDSSTFPGSGPDASVELVVSSSVD